MANKAFNEMKKNEQLRYLFSCLYSALSETNAMRQVWKTDVFGIAAQYGGRYNLNQKDFDSLKNKTIEELTNQLLNATS